MGCDSCEGRLPAAFLFVCLLFGTLLLSGCTAMGDALLSPVQRLLPVGNEDSSGRSFGDVPVMRVDLGAGRSGLFYLRNRSEEASHWIIGSGESVWLDGDRLGAFHADGGHLLMTSYRKRPSSLLPTEGRSIEYDILRSWRTSAGVYQSGRASVDLTCGRRANPPGFIRHAQPVYECAEMLAWDDGTTTRATYWYDLDSRHMIGATTTPWPNAPAVSWRRVN